MPHGVVIIVVVDCFTKMLSKCSKDIRVNTRIKHSYKRMNRTARCNCTYYEMVELVCVCVCVSVCLSVNRIIQDVLDDIFCEDRCWKKEDTVNI